MQEAGGLDQRPQLLWEGRAPGPGEALQPAKVEHGTEPVRQGGQSQGVQRATVRRINGVRPDGQDLMSAARQLRAGIRGPTSRAANGQDVPLHKLVPQQRVEDWPRLP